MSSFLRGTAALIIFIFLMPTRAHAQASGVVVEVVPPDAQLKRSLEAEIVPSAPPETVFEARRLARRAARKLDAFLNSRAYFAAKLTPGLTDQSTPYGQVTVQPGPAFTIGNYRIDFLDAEEHVSARQSVQEHSFLTLGATALPSTVITAEDALISTLRADGFADATLSERGVFGDREAGTVDVVLRARHGPRVHFGEVKFVSPIRTRPEVLRRLVPFETGKIYNTSDLRTLNARLTGTQLFSATSVRLADEVSGYTTEGEEIRNVLVDLTERKRYTVSLGGSFSTSEGPGAVASLDIRNPSRRTDTLSLTATLAAQQQALDAVWRLPSAFGHARGLTLRGRVGRDDTDAFDRTFFALGASSALRQSDVLSLFFGTNGEFSQETDVTGVSTFGIVSASAAFALDYSNDSFNPTRGWRIDGRVEPGIAIGDGGAQYVQFTSEVATYHPLAANDKWVAAIRARAGTLVGSSTLALPASRRFFAGGGGSARGFEFQSIGPVDVDGQPIGGRGLIEAAGELRWRPTQTLGFAAFIDTASITTSSLPSVGGLKYGAGAGVRYFTPIGPIRLDIGTPINPGPDDGPVQIYISLGQAF